jgi:hypothetical protein
MKVAQHNEPCEKINFEMKSSILLTRMEAQSTMQSRMEWRIIDWHKRRCNKKSTT